MSAVTPSLARTAFAHAMAARSIERPPLRLIGVTPWSQPSVARAAIRRRMPRWPEAVLIVLVVTTVCAGLLFVMLDTTATFLDTQMALVSASRASSSP